MIDAELVRLAQDRGATIVERGLGHVQIFGKLLVNYYPNTKNRTAYVAGTVKGHKNVSPEGAVNMAFDPPPLVRSTIRRRNNSRAKRAEMIRKGHEKCCWCKKLLTLDNSTIEHLIPLSRGGLDNANNRRIACHKCNQDRGHEMPELRA